MVGKRVLLLVVFLFSACSNDEAVPSGEILERSGNDLQKQELTLLTHDSFAISESVLASFEESHNTKILILPAGDAGAALNQAILTKDEPLADLFFGVDNTFMGRALEADIFVPYKADGLKNVDDDLKLDHTFRLLPIDFGDVCLNYDKDWFSEESLNPPTSLADLIDPDFEGLTVVQNPATSSPGLAFLLTTIDLFGIDGAYSYLDYWEDLRANNLLVVDAWDTAYYGHFTVSGTGSRPIVVSYASSPPAEVLFADPPIDVPPTAIVSGPQMCFRQIEHVGILAGTKNRQMSEIFIEFMLGKEFQEDIPLNMFVFPSNSDADLPQLFEDWAEVPSEPATIDPDAISANRDSWIQAWTETVLR